MRGAGLVGPHWFCTGWGQCVQLLEPIVPGRLNSLYGPLRTGTWPGRAELLSGAQVHTDAQIAATTGLNPGTSYSQGRPESVCTAPAGPLRAEIPGPNPPGGTHRWDKHLVSCNAAERSRASAGGIHNSGAHYIPDAASGLAGISRHFGLSAV